MPPTEAGAVLLGLGSWRGQHFGFCCWATRGRVGVPGWAQLLYLVANSFPCVSKALGDFPGEPGGVDVK